MITATIPRRSTPLLLIFPKERIVMRFSGRTKTHTTTFLNDAWQDDLEHFRKFPESIYFNPPSPYGGKVA